MKTDIFYSTVPGRCLFSLLQKAGTFRFVSWFLTTYPSRHLIPGYIKKYGIDMEPFGGQNYRSFSSFFARKREGDGTRSAPGLSPGPEVLISPCDGWLSVYRMTADAAIPMKGSVYGLSELLPDEELAGRFRNGLCLVLRLEAADYHHFCYFDDGMLEHTGFIPGQLHSVQPIAHRHVPVFRLNRRWWSVLETRNFGTAVQIEIGAMMVGGVSFTGRDRSFSRGEEMGHFELAGSTIVLLLDSAVREDLLLYGGIIPAMQGETEVRVRMGSAIGIMRGAQKRTRTEMSSWY